MDDLVKLSSVELTTKQQPLPPERRWMNILLALADDMRQSLTDRQLVLWQLKLADFPEADVEVALITGRWKFFPTCEEVMELCDRYAAERRGQLDYARQAVRKAEIERARKEWENQERQNWLRELARSVAAKMRDLA